MRTSSDHGLVNSLCKLWGFRDDDKRCDTVYFRRWTKHVAPNVGICSQNYTASEPTFSLHFKSTGHSTLLKERSMVHNLWPESRLIPNLCVACRGVLRKCGFACVSTHLTGLERAADQHKIHNGILRSLWITWKNRNYELALWQTKWLKSKWPGNVT